MQLKDLLRQREGRIFRSLTVGSLFYRFFELDKWWYDSFNGTPDAVVKWEANNQSLPSGIRLVDFLSCFFPPVIISLEVSSQDYVQIFFFFLPE